MWSLLSQGAEIVQWVVQGGGKVVDDPVKQNIHSTFFTLLDRQWSQSSTKAGMFKDKVDAIHFKIFVDLVVKHIQLVKE